MNNQLEVIKSAFKDKKKRTQNLILLVVLLVILLISCNYIFKSDDKTNKSITLEPMNAYERKIIHSKLQDMKDIKTHSIGEEPHRRIVIEKINK